MFQRLTVRIVVIVVEKSTWKFLWSNRVHLLMCEPILSIDIWVIIASMLLIMIVSIVWHIMFHFLLLELMVSVVMLFDVLITVVDDMGIMKSLVVHGQSFLTKLHKGMWMILRCHFGQLRLIFLGFACLFVNLWR